MHVKKGDKVVVISGTDKGKIGKVLTSLPKKNRVIDIKVVTDERICDGFYFASAFKALKRYVENPERLTVPPTEVLEDID